MPVAAIGLGTLIRLLYGLRAQSWLAAPDQIAWGLLLEEARRGPVRIDQLMQTPHEGGTTILSLAALAVGRVDVWMPAVSWVVLGADTLVRAAQIGLARWVFGDRTALWFAVWTIFAAPLLLPAGTVHAGHSLASVWPFMFLAVAAQQGSPRARLATLGAVVGLSLCWSFDGVALLPVLVLAAVLPSEVPRPRAALLALGGLVCGAAPYLAIRILADTGFALEQAPLVWLRGIDFEVPTLSALWAGWRAAWRLSLPGSSLLPAMLVSMDAARVAWGVLLVAGAILGVALATERRSAWLAAAAVVSFVSLYGASPLLLAQRDHESFVAYRHWTFIIPLLALLAVRGYSTLRMGRIALGAIIAMGIAGGLILLDRQVPQPRPAYKPAGWILARKLGHDTPRLVQLLETAPAGARADLTFGYGWGLTATLLATPAAGVERVAAVTERLRSFPDELEPSLVEGALFAFQDGVTPRLDPALRAQLAERLAHR